MDDNRRRMLEKVLRSQCERNLEARIDRYLAMDHQRIIGDHHFAHASSECLELYRDGYFLSCVMVVQAVGEGIAKFVAERNSVTRLDKETNQALVRRLNGKGIVSNAFAEAFARIQSSHRNDYHHMNPPVGGLDHESLAVQNLLDLAVIEREIFECSFGAEGTLVPRHSLYWDNLCDGLVPAYLRLA